MCKQIDNLIIRIEEFFNALKNGFEEEGSLAEGSLAEGNIFKFMEFLVELSSILNELRISKKNPYDNIDGVMGFKNSELFITELVGFTGELLLDEFFLFGEETDDAKCVLTNELLQSIQTEAGENLER